jgi:phage-related protein
MWETFKSANAALWQGIGDTIVNAWNFVYGWVTSKVNEFINWISNGWANLQSMTKQAWDNFMQTIANTVNNVITFVRNIPGNIVNALGNLGTLLINAGRDIITGLYNGIVSMGGWLKDQILNFVRTFVPGPVLQFLGIASPSKLFADIGRWIPAGLGGGIIANAAAATDASRELATRTALAAMEGTRGALAGTSLDMATIGGRVAGGDGATTPVDPRDPRLGGGDAPRFLMPVTINNPVAERSSDAIGRAGSVLAAVGPWGDD